MLIITGLMNGGWRFVIQSLPQSTNHQIIFPVKEQTTVNQKSGRYERIFVNLESIYPTPEVDGTELSLEELQASARGWLSKSWKPQQIDGFKLKKANPSIPVENNSPSGGVNSLLIDEFAEKLVIARDPVVLDENNAVKETGREGRNRKFKTMEVNETQISEIFFLVAMSFADHKQSKQSCLRRRAGS